MANNSTNGKLGLLTRPIMQMGFAGLSVILLAIICWLIHSKDITLDKVMELQRETNRVVERNTAAMQELSRVVHDKFFRSEK